MAELSKIENLLVNLGLYDSTEISIDDLDEIEKMLSKSEYTENTIDCYCVDCGTDRTFEFTRSEVQEYTGVVKLSVYGGKRYSRLPSKKARYKSYLNQSYSLTYRCTRERQHAILFNLVTTDNRIIKIGQFPSVADLLIPKITKYKSILGEQYHELRKAIGLFAHGIGIGSFVYLRRIIENLVLEKYEEFSVNLDISKKDFINLKFDEKIEILKMYLPTILVENKNIYHIVSKGIHELNEDECRNMFLQIKVGIELILDEMLIEKERAIEGKTFKKFVEKKTGELRRQ